MASTPPSRGALFFLAPPQGEIENACNECGEDCKERHSTADWPILADVFKNVEPRICCSYACLRSYVRHTAEIDLDAHPRPAPPQGEATDSRSSGGYAAPSLAPPQGHPTPDATDDYVWVRLRWMSGEPIAGRFKVLSVEEFLINLDDGNIPGVPACRDREVPGHYELVWGTMLLDPGDEHDDDYWFSELGVVNDTELTLLFVRE